MLQEDMILEDANDSDILDTNKQKRSSTTKRGLPQGWTRTTITLKDEHLENLKSFAYWARANQQEVLSEILDKFFSARKVRPIPKNRKILDEE